MGNSIPPLKPIINSEYKKRPTIEHTQWNCPHCNRFFDEKTSYYEEYSIGGYIRHIKCPSCKKCMGCKH